MIRVLPHNQAPMAIVRRINAAASRGEYCYVHFAGDKTRVVAARFRRGVLYFRALHDGNWFPEPEPSNEYTISIEPY